MFQELLRMGVKKYKCLTKAHKAWQPWISTPTTFASSLATSLFPPQGLCMCYPSFLVCSYIRFSHSWIFLFIPESALVLFLQRGTPTPTSISWTSSWWLPPWHMPLFEMIVSVWLHVCCLSSHQHMSSMRRRTLLLVHDGPSRTCNGPWHIEDTQ